MDGWLKLHRSIIDSAVFEDSEILKIWIWLLCNVAFEEHDTIYLGKVIHLKKGQIATGRKKMAQQIGISENRVYRALNILQQLGNINIKSNNKYSLITLENWAKYQQDQTANEQQNNSKINSKPTAKQTANEHNKRNKERKESKECLRMNEIEPCEAHDHSPIQPKDDIFSSAENQMTPLGGIGKGVVMMSDAQMEDLLEKLSLEEFDKYVGIVADNELSGKHYTKKTHYTAILDMAAKDRKLLT